MKADIVECQDKADGRGTPYQVASSSATAGGSLEEEEGEEAEGEEGDWLDGVHEALSREGQQPSPSAAGSECSDLSSLSGHSLVRHAKEGGGPLALLLAALRVGITVVKVTHMNIYTFYIQIKSITTA
jgi:hypothetical protein